MNIRFTLNLRKNILIGFFIAIFIIIYLIYLVFAYSLPLQYGIPIIQFIGFALIIIGFFYFFLHLIRTKENEIILEFNVFNEETICSLLMGLMIITFFIPPVSFSDMIIDWSQISPLNYIKGIIFLIGIAFVPGSCIYYILFPENSLPQKFNVEPFFLKLIFYPVMSFSFLGVITLIFAAIGISREFFPVLLFFSILAVFCGAIGTSKHRGRNIRLFKPTKVKVSKYTAFILLLAFSVIIIAFGLHMHTLYLQENDGYRVITYAAFIGTQEGDVYTSYAAYWAYISFGLNALTGIPIINVNAMLFSFLYLFVCGLYLVIKSFLKPKYTKYAILGTLFAITFSNLFYLFQNIPPHERISLFVFDGLFNFRYKSFSLILFFIALSIFMILLKEASNTPYGKFERKMTYLLIFLSSFFLFQSFIIYYFPVISFILLALCLFIFSKQKLTFFKVMITYLVCFFTYFLIFDILSHFFFSLTLISRLRQFQGLFFNVILLIINLPSPINQILIYIIFIGFILSIFGVFIIYKKLINKTRKIKHLIKVSKKRTYHLIMVVISILLILELMLNIIRTLQSLYNFTLFLDLIFYNIGIIGIIALYSLSKVYKLNKKVLYTLFLWFILTFALALIGFFSNTFSYPSLTPLEWPGDAYFRWISYWFQRIWYYSIIPLSLFASIGIITFLKDYDNSKVFKWRFRLQYRHFVLILCSGLVFLSLSNTILSGIAFQNQKNNSLTDEEAQITGWVCEHLPPDSHIIVDRRQLDKYLGLISATNTGLMSNPDIIDHANYQNINYLVYKFLNESCELNYYDKIETIDRIIEFNDTNINGQILIEAIFKTGIENGSFDFFVKTSNSSKGWWFNGSRLEDLTAFSFYVKSSHFFGLNGSIYQPITPVEDNKWYHIIIDFECSLANYSGLTQYQWKITINNTGFGPFYYGGNVDYIDQLKFYTSIADANWIVQLSQFNLSRDTDFRLEYFLFNYASLFDYLISQNYQYLILSSVPTEYRLELEKYIDVENTLIPKFYKNKLFSYKTLTVYGT